MAFPLGSLHFVDLVGGVIGTGQVVLDRVGPQRLIQRLTLGPVQVTTLWRPTVPVPATGAVTKTTSRASSGTAGPESGAWRW